MQPRPQQQRIIEALNVHPTPNAESYDIAFERIDFLMNYLLHSGARGFVLGISGGQDSALAAKLANEAVKKLNCARSSDTPPYLFVAVRLPYGTQADEDDAMTVIDWIKPDLTCAVDIKPAVDASLASLAKVGIVLSDFHKGNTKARERMKVQYDLAANMNLLVIGTDHAAEAVTGFFTKYGDGACDIAPLAGFTKLMGKSMLQRMAAPAVVYTKAPTADLEDDRPCLTDEEALGISYKDLDQYLMGARVNPVIAHKIEARYALTEHKRHLPVTPNDTWWHA